tara:strand:- start:62 stop:181 length:120 start_codon:yes stop_codon:yes gene_type:complete
MPPDIESQPDGRNGVTQGALIGYVKASMNKYISDRNLKL